RTWRHIPVSRRVCKKRTGISIEVRFSTSTNRNMRKDKIMKNASTITVERVTPKIVKIKFANPPVNLIIPETVTRLHEVVKELCEDEKVHVVIFTSGIADYFYNHLTSLVCPSF